MAENQLTDERVLEAILAPLMAAGSPAGTSRKLIARFGSLAQVLSAPSQRVLEVPGVGRRVTAGLGIVRVASRRLTRWRLRTVGVILDSRWALDDYCAAHMAHEEREQLRVLFLNKANVLISDEVMQEGTVDHVHQYVREIIRRCLELSASAMIVMHNHPSDNPSPSAADISADALLNQTASRLGIIVHPHVIVSRSGNTVIDRNRIPRRPHLMGIPLVGHVGQRGIAPTQADARL